MRNPYVPDGEPLPHPEVDKTLKRPPNLPGRFARRVKLDRSISEVNFTDIEGGPTVGVRLKGIFRRGGIVVVEQASLHDVMGESFDFGTTVADKKSIGDGDEVTLHRPIRNHKGVIIGAGVALATVGVVGGSLKKIKKTRK